MRKIYKFLVLALTVMFCAVMTACGTYIPPTVQQGGSTGGGTSSEGGDTPSQGEQDGEFNVTLLWNNENFTQEECEYQDITRIQAIWTNLETAEKYSAHFNEQGVASIEGLDGDYRVTISAPPVGYTYNPNDDEHIATNVQKSVEISIYQLTPITAGGTDPYNDVINITQIGAYRITLETPDQEVWCRVTPTSNGTYTMESMVDVTANKVNPVLYVYHSSSEMVYVENPNEIIDGGGYEGTFTKNFYWEFNMTSEEAGGATMHFRIVTTNQDVTAYPIDIDFIYDREGDFASGLEPSVVVTPTHDFSTWNPSMTPSGTFTYCAYGPGSRGIRLLDDDMVGLGEDGYYHYLDNLGNPTGPMLFAKINKRTEVMSEFTWYQVNLSYIDGKSYYDFIHSYYAANVNDDGCYPVTEELKQFIQLYATENDLFKDGNGYAEVPRADDPETTEEDPFLGYNSDESSMWMFACGYYA